MNMTLKERIEVLRFLIGHRPDFGTVAAGAIIALIALHIAGFIQGPSHEATQNRPLPAPSKEEQPAPAPAPLPQNCVALPNGERVCDAFTVSTDGRA